MAKRVRFPVYIPVFLGFLGALTLPVASSEAASAYGTASATVIDGVLKVKHECRLKFGTIKKGSHAGKVIVTPKKQRQITGGVKMESGGFAPARLSVYGSAKTTYRIYLPDSVTFTVDDDHDQHHHTRPHCNHPSHDGIRELTVTDFTLRSDNIGAITNSHSKLDKHGEDRLAIGGTLIVPANAAPGSYSGFVPVTVSY